MIADPTKGPAVVLLLTRGTNVLALTRRSAIHDLHLPGGKVEPEDQDEAHAATRELAEETGEPGWPETFRPTEARGAMADHLGGRLMDDDEHEPVPEAPEEMPPIHQRPTKHGPYSPWDWEDNREPPVYWHRPASLRGQECRCP